MKNVSAVVWNLTEEKVDLTKLKNTGMIPLIHSFWKTCDSAVTPISYGLNEIGSKYQITIILEDGTEFIEHLTFERGEQCIDVFRTPDGKAFVKKMRPHQDIAGGCDPTPVSCKK